MIYLYRGDTFSSFIDWSAAMGLERIDLLTAFMDHVTPLPEGQFAVYLESPAISDLSFICGRLFSCGLQHQVVTVITDKNIDSIIRASTTTLPVEEIQINLCLQKKLLSLPNEALSTPLSQHIESLREHQKILDQNLSFAQVNLDACRIISKEMTTILNYIPTQECKANAIPAINIRSFSKLKRGGNSAGLGE